MSINIHDLNNRFSYVSREEEINWLNRIEEYVDVQGTDILDLGCGEGIYSKVLAKGGAGSVTAMDCSADALKKMAEYCRGIKQIKCVQGDALDTSLKDAAFDIVLKRALIYHMDQLEDCFKEANRLLRRNGVLIVQDRTPEDCALPGSKSHIGGYFFECYPELLKKEQDRRHNQQQVKSALNDSGFKLINELKFWETRNVYTDIRQLKLDLVSRTGRSILNELSDVELSTLIEYIQHKFESTDIIHEEDRWTMWIAEKL